MAERDQWLSYAFPFSPTVQGKLDGGLPATILRQIRLREQTPNGQLYVLSPDTDNEQFPDYGVTVIAVEPETIPNGDRFGAWFGDMWVVLHPHAHIAEGGYPTEVLSALFPGDTNTQPVGSIDRAIEHVAKHGFIAKNPEVMQTFTARFDSAIEKIQRGSIINWQDYMFAPAMLKHSAALRKQECWQSFHLHTTLPPQLYRFEQGRMLLEAMSLMDRVYVHTDVYQTRLEDQLIMLGLPVPEIQRFDLGIDTISIRQRLDAVTKDTYTSTPEYLSLPDDQREVLDEIVATQDSDFHRFICIDRADPGKGQSVVLEAMDTVLSHLSEEERERFRFYFIMPQFNWNAADNHPQQQYIKYLQGKFAEMKQKYPSVLHYTYGLPPKLIPFIVCNAHGITGGIEDGLCLSPMEVLKANALAEVNKTAIIGLGSGFAMQTYQSERHRDLIRLVRRGSVADIVETIRDIVDIEQQHATELGERTRMFVKEVIDKRTDGVLVYPTA